MTDPADTAQRQQARQQGLIVALITVPFRFVGVLGGSLLLSLVMEGLGLAFVWPDQGWHHAQRMLQFELDQLSLHFAQSALLHEPTRTAYHMVTWAYEAMFMRSGLLAWVQTLSSPTGGALQHGGFHEVLCWAYVHADTYLRAAAYTLLTFLVRLLVLGLTLPLFAIAAFVGLVDGLVRRDVRRFGAGRESGFVHHRAKASLMPLAVLPWVTYLALPVSVSPVWILLPSAILLGVAVDIATGSFKKYL